MVNQSTDRKIENTPDKISEETLRDMQPNSSAFKSNINESQTITSRQSQTNNPKQTIPNKMLPKKPVVAKPQASIFKLFNLQAI
ncbi:MAG: hypothetical protein KME07_05795 [Pegethrix bostrychoides GSE-TBD4-15B]|uniref:Uncharacterized protein n=1 Tax=Pegethrix bostrychoides GSE-TBD4-15B TaxID=2839662 RepID=A0A951U3R7_9CYAN|nr:hypothetical protein [Pegethrix bostrychoides GSE-TBD4-15B]